MKEHYVNTKTERFTLYRCSFGPRDEREGTVVFRGKFRDFRASAPDFEENCETFNEAKKKLLEHVKAYEASLEVLDIQWIPVIVQLPLSAFGSVRVDSGHPLLSAYRCWIGVQDQHLQWTAEWDEGTDDDLKRTLRRKKAGSTLFGALHRGYKTRFGDFPLYCGKYDRLPDDMHEEYRKKSVLLNAYTSEIWQALETIRGRHRELMQQLASLDVTHLPALTGQLALPGIHALPTLMDPPTPQGEQ